MDSLLKASEHCSVGKLAIRFEEETGRFFSRDAKSHCCCCALQIAKYQHVQREVKKRKEDECRGKVKLGSVSAPSSTSRP